MSGVVNSVDILSTEIKHAVLPAQVIPASSNSAASTQVLLLNGSTFLDGSGTVEQRLPSSTS